MRKASVFMAVILSLIISGCVNDLPENQVCINEKCFDVELATTTQERAQGLMGRNKLDAGRGMLFVFEDEGNHSFWMKDMKFALDIIWLNTGREIVYISSYTQPCELLKPCPSITPPVRARYVLEVGAGEAYELGIGDKAVFSGDF